MSWQTDYWNIKKDIRKFKKDLLNSGKIAAAIVIAVVVIWLVSSVHYTVDADQQAVILRFGRAIATQGPGIHLKLPFGIDAVIKAEVKEVKKEEFGFRTEEAGVKTVYVVDTPMLQDEARILTGDLNILMLKWVVRYKIDNIQAYLFSVRDPRRTVRDVSEAAMRLVVGDSSVDEILTIGRARIQDEVKLKIQKKIEVYRTGLQVVDVRLKEASPPGMVKEAFNSVNKARQQKEKIINEAESERNSKIPEARGKKIQVIEEARGYAAKRVNEAQGDVALFRAVLEAYEKSPEVTEKRIYLETMQQVFKRVKTKYIISRNSADVLKFFNIRGDREKEGGLR